MKGIDTSDDNPLTRPDLLSVTDQCWEAGITPLVSIVCNTFNQANFIKDAIEGFLLQKTTFPVEILIHDDASTDGTSGIVREYEARYPKLIKPLYQSENQYSKGIRIAPSFQFPRSRGKYIALCEGDDYWTDPLKLQKQFDVLEQQPAFSFCVHDAYTQDSHGRKKLFTVNLNQSSNVFGAREIIRVKGQFAPTASYFFRSSIREKLPNWAYTAPVVDLLFEMYAMKVGRGIYLNENMCVYRIFALNSWTSKFKNHKNFQFIIDFGKNQLSVIQHLKKDFPEIEDEFFQAKESLLLRVIAEGNLLGGRFKEYQVAIESSWNKVHNITKGQTVLFKLRNWPKSLRILLILLLQISSVNKRIKA